MESINIETLRRLIRAQLKVLETFRECYDEGTSQVVRDYQLGEKMTLFDVLRIIEDPDYANFLISLNRRHMDES